LRNAALVEIETSLSSS